MLNHPVVMVMNGKLQDISLNLQEEKMDDEVCIYNNVGK